MLRAMIEERGAVTGKPHWAEDRTHPIWYQEDDHVDTHAWKYELSGFQLSSEESHRGDPFIQVPSSFTWSIVTGKRCRTTPVRAGCLILRTHRGQNAACRSPPCPKGTQVGNEMHQRISSWRCTPERGRTLSRTLSLHHLPLSRGYIRV